MTMRLLNNLKTPIGDLLSQAGPDGILLQPAGQSPYALIPLDDDLTDYLVERNPKFIESCRQIQERMKEGQFHSHEEVKKLLAAE